jgi:hypothetical protein
MDSKEFLDSLLDKDVCIKFRDTGESIGTLVWNDPEAIGVKYNNGRIVLYYKHSIRSIESAKK